MKRKLCCAVALVGDPHVVLLDEPSAGLDPVSQRNLWNLIKSTMTGRAVLLTTHSMLEADALCDRVGIQVRGQFHCVGSCVEINQCVGCTKSFLGDDAVVLAPSSGEEPASPRHRASVASMA